MRTETVAKIMRRTIEGIFAARRIKEAVKGAGVSSTPASETGVSAKPFAGEKPKAKKTTARKKPTAKRKPKGDGK